MINYRTFEPSDLAGVRAVLEALGWAPQYVTGQLESVQALHRDPNSRVLVAAANEAVIGFITVLFAAWNRLAQVHGLAVAPAFRRHGAASALVAAAEDFARAQAARGVFVDTPVDNHAARAFYLANGYREAYVMPEYYAEGLDGVTYLKLFGR